MSNTNTPPVRSPDDGGTRTEKRDLAGNDKRQAPAALKTSGASSEARDTSKSDVANRDIEGPRKAGLTPRPTDKPIVGGDKG